MTLAFAALSLRSSSMGSWRIIARSSRLFSMQTTVPSFARQMSMDAKSVASQLNGSGLLRTQGLVGGKWSDAYDGKTIKVYNPATGESIADIACMGERETNDAISSAYDAFLCMGFHTFRIYPFVSLLLRKRSNENKYHLVMTTSANIAYLVSCASQMDQTVLVMLKRRA